MLTTHDDILISIIVPVYNAEAYLERCIESVLQQKEQNYELIAIDDGSSDRSLAILESYRSDARIKVISQANGGVSSARNRGIAASTGKYLCFLDADDFLPESALTTWSSLMNEHVGLIVGESQHFTPQGVAINPQPAKAGVRQLAASDAINDILYFNPKHGICDKIFSGERVRAHQLRFNEAVFNFEDLLFVINYLHLLQGESVVFTETVVYHYVVSENSATRSAIKEKHFSYAQSFSEIKRYLSDKNNRFYYHLLLKVTSSHIYKAIHAEGFSRGFINDYIALYRRSFRAYFSSGMIFNAWSLYFTLFFFSPRLVSHLRKMAQKSHQ